MMTKDFEGAANVEQRPEGRMDCHGAPLRIPQVWQDHSLYRFSLPSEEKLQVPLQPTASAQPPFRPNVVVAKVRPDGPLSEESAFGEMNRKQAAANPSYKVIASGGASLGALSAVWQDVTLMIAKPHMQLFQRNVAIDVAEGHLVSITFTNNHNDLVAPLAEMGLQFE